MSKRERDRERERKRERQREREGESIYYLPKFSCTVYMSWLTSCLAWVRKWSPFYTPLSLEERNTISHLGLIWLQRS